MKPHQILDCVATPDGRELVLYQHGDDFLIEVDREELMSSRTHGSEVALARLALEALGKRAATRVLVGGLGMGFTLRATLDGLKGRPRASVVVAEFFPAVVAWNRAYLRHLAGSPLTDKRVRLAQGDVALQLREGVAPFDVILLDVDNGPDAFSLDRNRHLYGRRGLERLHRALTPGGILAVWSAADDKHFVSRLRRAGFATTSHRVPARANGKGGWHYVFLGRRG